MDESQVADLSNTIECHVYLLPQIMLHLSPQLFLLLAQITKSFLPPPPRRSGREKGRRIRTFTITVEAVTYKVCHCVAELFQLLLKVEVLVSQCLHHLLSSQSSIHLEEGGDTAHLCTHII